MREPFKAYDIRGIFGQNLDEELAYNIGRAFVTFTKAKEVVVGKDMRETTPKLFDALARGITGQGADVLDIGLCTSPMLYFAVGFYKKSAGAMVTASHNPKQYNGFKFCREKAIPIGADSGMEDIYNLVQAKKFPNAQHAGRIIRLRIIPDYVSNIMKMVMKMGGRLGARKLKVVVDTGNGMGGFEFPHFMKKLPKSIEFIPMYFQLDGNFPNHTPDPLDPKNMADLQQKVREEKADLGIAFDGDADRAGFVDEQGNIITNDLVGALIAKQILRDNPGGRVLYDLRSSWVVKETIESDGGKANMCRVGHSFIKRQMRDEDAIFAIELSGHFYFRDNFFAESPVAASLLILEQLSGTEKPISELVKPLRRYFHSGEINFRVDDKDAAIARIESLYKGLEASHLDGLRMEGRDFWFNIRKSNTEPLLRLNLEARSKAKLQEMTERLRQQIEV